MSDAPVLSLGRRIVRLAGSGTIATLILLLVALWVVFAIASAIASSQLTRCNP